MQQATRGTYEMKRQIILTTYLLVKLAYLGIVQVASNKALKKLASLPHKVTMKTLIKIQYKENIIKSHHMIIYRVKINLKYISTQHTTRETTKPKI